jgi:hypothetical protein
MHKGYNTSDTIYRNVMTKDVLIQDVIQTHPNSILRNQGAPSDHLDSQIRLISLKAWTR